MNNNFEEELNQIGRRIKEIRLEKNLTQSGLASSCDVDIRTIQRIEKGTYNMSFKILYFISNTLEITLSDLLKDNETE